jgi:membrane protein
MSSAAPSAEQGRPDTLGAKDLRSTQGADPHAEAKLGHGARTPTQIPAAGWWDVLKRVWNETGSDQMSLIAASCAFYALLALFPAISVLISLYGLLFDPAAVQSQVQAMQGVLPDAAYQMISQRVTDVASTTSSALSWGLGIGIAFALWSASAGTKALMSSLNIAYEEEEKRGFIKYNLAALGFTLVGIIGVTVALTVIVGLPAILHLDWLGPMGAIAARVISYVVLLGFVILGLALVYRYAPSRDEAKWRWLTPGSILAAVVWLVASVGFSFYVSNFGSYDATYGSLGAVIVVLMWFYISAFVVMLGAELNAELELQTQDDTTSGPDRPMGRRGAFVADNVARAH